MIPSKATSEQHALNSRHNLMRSFRRRCVALYILVTGISHLLVLRRSHRYF